jgi:peptide/nickel transport system substrate-binding protein
MLLSMANFHPGPDVRGGRAVPSVATRGVIIALVLMLSACAQPGYRIDTGKGGDGSLRILLPSDPPTLHPNMQRYDEIFFVASNLFNKLVTLDSDYKILPDLATRWSESEDGLAYSFELADNVFWHDGHPFDSGDVRWTFEAIKYQKWMLSEDLDRISSIETPDRLHVIIRLKEAWAPFLPTIAWQWAFILPEHLFRQAGFSQSRFDEHPVGTGPFSFKAWDKGKTITLKANTKYFKRGPFIDRLTFRILQPGEEVVSLLKSGEVDYTLQQPALSEIADLRQNPALNVRIHPNPGRFYLGFNQNRLPLGDLRVRRAINMAIDRTELASRAMMGYAAPAFGFYTPVIAWAYNPSARTPELDVPAAEQLLDEAGLPKGKDGIRHRFTFATIKRSPLPELAEILKEQLDRVGLGIEIEYLSYADYTRKIYSERDVDMAIFSGTQGPDPNNMVMRFSSRPGGHFMGDPSPDFDEALRQGAKSRRISQRARFYYMAQEIMARDLPIAPLVENVQPVIYNRNIIGLPHVEARGLVTFTDFSLVRIKKDQTPGVRQ